MANKEKALREQIIKVGARLYQIGLAVAKSGNISARLDNDFILISATQTFLGDLKEEEIVKVNLNTSKAEGDKNPSSELPLHILVYKNFPARVIIHAHPPLINGYFAVNDTLETLTFETKFYLGNISVVSQDAPTVTKPELVIETLKSNNLIVLKNHGVISIGEKFKDALSLIEALEEAVKTASIAKLFKKETLSKAEQALMETIRGNSCKKDFFKDNIVYSMFSREHIQAIVDLVNKDEFIVQKGKELDLTMQLAIKLDETDKVWRFSFERGKITSLDNTQDAPFVISAPANIWEQVFLGKLDSFVAVTQGKMKLQGQLGQLSRWYVPFSRLFELFKQVKFR